MSYWQLARSQWDRALGAALFVLGGLFVLLGWVGVAGEALTARQIPYVISGGIGGIFLLGLGAVFWISADLRDEWRKLDSIERLLGTAQEETPDAAPSPSEDEWASAATPAATPVIKAPATPNGRRIRPLRVNG